MKKLMMIVVMFLFVNMTAHAQCQCANTNTQQGYILTHQPVTQYKTVNGITYAGNYYQTGYFDNYGRPYYRIQWRVFRRPSLYPRAVPPGNINLADPNVAFWSAGMSEYYYRKKVGNLFR